MQKKIKSISNGNSSLFSKIKALFQRQPQQKVPQMPPFEEIVGMMYDMNLDAFSDEVIQVIYSKDKTMRYVILKDERQLLTYQLEAIYQFEKDEWKFIFSDKNSLPAMWEPYGGKISKSSIFSNIDELLAELTSQPEYKLYFK